MPCKSIQVTFFVTHVIAVDIMNDISSASSQQNNDFVVNGNKKENIPNALTNKEVINPTMKLETMDSSQVASVPERIKSVNMTQDSHPPLGQHLRRFRPRNKRKRRMGKTTMTTNQEQRYWMCTKP